MKNEDNTRFMKLSQEACLKLMEAHLPKETIERYFQRFSDGERVPLQYYVGIPSDDNMAFLKELEEL